jgi:hypothetical protein
MKIRIKGNSVRMRITRSELDRVESEGLVKEQTEFGNATLIYMLMVADVNDLSATFDNNCVTMLVPRAFAREWVDTERVGFENNMNLPNGKKLFLLIEKDFKCLDETHEDQGDNFDNPLLARN